MAAGGNPKILQSMPSRRFRVQDYLVALAAVAGVTAVRMLLDWNALAPNRMYIVFTLGVLIGALYGGLGAGLFATILSTVVVDVVFLVPQHKSVIHTTENVVPMILFILEGGVISWLAGNRADVLEDLRTTNQELESRVLKRTQQLQGANTQLEEQAAENRKIMEELRINGEQLQRSNRELEDFASVASHDLQEPLRKIQAFGDRLKVKAGDRLGEDGSDYLKRMLNAAGRMQRLINDLLSFSRVTTRAQPFVPVDLSRIAQEVLADLEMSVELNAGVVQITNLPTIDADATQMRQVLQNLIGNALKFHRPEVSPIVKVAGSVHQNGAGEECELTVSDNGIGFEEKYLDRIFNIFQRLHGRGTYEGTGIGLAVCRKIVERHGGTITATSAPGIGSTFIIRLPVHHPQPEANNDARSQTHHDPSGG